MNKKWKLISYVLAGALLFGVSGTTLTGCKDYDDDIDSLNARVDETAKSASEALDSKVKTLETQISTLTSAKDQLAKDLEAAKASADQKVAEAKQAASGAQGTADNALKSAQEALSEVATLKSQISRVDTDLSSLNAELSSLKEEVSSLNGELSSLKEEVAGVKNETNEEFIKVNQKVDEVKSELLASLSVLESSVNGVSDDILKLRQDFDAANKAIGLNTAAIDGLKEQFLTLQKGLETQKEALDIYKTEVAEQLGDKVDKATLDAKIGEINSSIDALQEKVDGLAEKWQADIAEAIETHVTSKDFANKTELKTAVDGLDTKITETLEGYVTTEVLAEYLGETGTITKEIASVSDKLNTLSSLFSKRLTAMIFAPTAYVDGIEVIEFATLKYTNWDNLTGDIADGEQTVTINNGATKAEYYVSPSNVTKESVKGLSILLNNATNIQSKATDALPLEIKDYTFDGSGKMVVSLKKTIPGAFLDKDGKFLVMALQATVEPTEEEKKAEVTPVVTSDWARIYETSVTPYIHNTAAETCDVEDENGSASQFYTYSEIHSNGGSKVEDEEGICDTDGKYIVKKLAYTEPFDLNTLVTVCDKEGNFYNAADYGLKFEFKLVKYVLQDENEVKTLQHNFAKIDKNGMITSCANNGKPNNADAVGREPMIQVILRDPAHNENVVDVRYFKIKWIAQPKTTILEGTIKDFEKTFTCGDAYSCVVGTEEMNNKVYTKVNYSKEMFHTLYKLEEKVYASVDEAIAGTPAATNLGTITEIPAAGSTVTYNLNWNYTVGDITDAEYEAGQAVRTVYGRYVHKGNDADIIVFSLKLIIKIEKMKVRGYNAPQWGYEPVLSTDANKVYTVNPQLREDAIYGHEKFKDCQIITDLLNGYAKRADGQPTKVLDVVSGAASKANFMFDEARLTATLGAGWKVSVDGKTLLDEDDVVAARIEEGIIRLEESPVPTKENAGKPTVAAQKLLGKNVPVKLVAVRTCESFEKDITKTVDQFLVKFLEPLKMTVNQEETNLYDIKNGGSTISVKKAVTLKEAFGEETNIIYIVNGELKESSELKEWYGVGATTWDLSNATANVKVVEVDGLESVVYTEKCDNPWSAVADRYNLTCDGVTLKFENKSGSSLGQAIQVKIPVSLVTKWKPSLTDSDQGTVTVTINPVL